MTVEISELKRVGAHILQARRDRGFNQSDLASRSSLSQVQISGFERGQRRATLTQLLKIAKALDVPIQRLLTGSDRPGEGLTEIAIELRRMGIEDLWVQGAVVPGAFRRPEEVICLALSPREPDPRVVEAIPAVLAWNEINPALLRAHGAVTRTTARVAWLADIALSIDKDGGFPGGCRRGPLERFLAALETAKKRAIAPPRDDLGKPTFSPPTSPIWKRWSINYGASLAEFSERARHLDNLRNGPRTEEPSTRLVSSIRKGRGGTMQLRTSMSSLAPQEEKTRPSTPRATPKVRKPRKGDDSGRP